MNPLVVQCKLDVTLPVSVLSLPYVQLEWHGCSKFNIFLNIHLDQQGMYENKEAHDWYGSSHFIKFILASKTKSCVIVSNLWKIFCLISESLRSKII
jgi:hypothetical protein